MRILEGEEREKGTEEIFKVIMIDNFPKLITDTKPHIREAEGTPSRVNTTKITPRYIVLKLKIRSQRKEEILKNAREKTHTI